MAYVTCPDCFARFPVADAAAESTVHCPKCMRAFVAAGSVPLGRGADGAGRGGEEPYGDKAARVLSAADEAMLRELGSGSGLLEMTRAAMDSVPVNMGPQALAGVPEVSGISDRQFQIVGTALTMANKLTEVYKGELARARRMLIVAWTGSVIMLGGALVAFGWGMAQSSSASLERSNLANSAEKVVDLRGHYEEEKGRSLKMEAEIATLRTDLRKAQADLTAAQAAASQSRAEAEVLGTDLRLAKVKIAQLQDQLDRAKAAATTAPATQAAAGDAVVRP